MRTLKGQAVKSCITCGPKPIDEFGIDRCRPDGLNPYCRFCTAERTRKAREIKHFEGLRSNDPITLIGFMDKSEEAVERNRMKRREEERIAQQLAQSEKYEHVEPLSFSSLGFMLGRQGNRPSAGWDCPIGVASR